jgi:hypothetical protein
VSASMILINHASMLLLVNRIAIVFMVRPGS